MRKVLLTLTFAAAVTAVAVIPCWTTSSATVEDAEAPRVLVNVDRNGLALQGYDPVAYFTMNRPVLGDPRFHARYQGATYRFSSRENVELFESDPAKYSPQYGGYCGYAASINKISPISPEWFQIIEGRLILQHNKRAWDLWNEDLPGNVGKADANWPGLVARNGEPLRDRTLVNVTDDGVALQGYDPVAYFTDGQPVRGDQSFEATYGGGIYRFASTEHKELFEHDPWRYVPAYGGFCAYAASIKKVSPIDPTIFQIEDGRLMLPHTQKAYDLFNKDTRANIARADTNWPGLVAKKGR